MTKKKKLTLFEKNQKASREFVKRKRIWLKMNNFHLSYNLIIRELAKAVKDSCVIIERQRKLIKKNDSAMTKAMVDIQRTNYTKGRL